MHAVAQEHMHAHARNLPSHKHTRTPTKGTRALDHRVQEHTHTHTHGITKRTRNLNTYKHTRARIVGTHNRHARLSQRARATRAGAQEHTHARAIHPHTSTHVRPLKACVLKHGAQDHTCTHTHGMIIRARATYNTYKHTRACFVGTQTGTRACHNAHEQRVRSGT
jgi:hypothetical protein